MKRFTTEEQTKELKLLFPDPVSMTANKIGLRGECIEINYRMDYSIGELIGFLTENSNNLSIYLENLEWTIIYETGHLCWTVSSDKELVDALYHACIRLKSANFEDEI